MRAKIYLLPAILLLPHSVVWGHSPEEAKRQERNLAFRGKITDTPALHLRIAYPVIFRNELPCIVIGLKNTTSQAITLFRDVDWFVDSSRRNMQLWFEVSQDGKRRYDLDAEIGREWKEMESDDLLSRVRVLPGEALVVNGRDMCYSGAPWRTPGVKSIRALLMIGDGLFVASEWHQITVLDRSIYDTASWHTIPFRVLPDWPEMRLCINEIGDVRWLFLEVTPSYGQRICRVPGDLTPDLEVRRDGGRFNKHALNVNSRDYEGGPVLYVGFPGRKSEKMAYMLNDLRFFEGDRELAPHIHADVALRTKLKDPDTDK